MEEVAQEELQEKELEELCMYICIVDGLHREVQRVMALVFACRTCQIGVEQGRLYFCD